MRTPTPETNNQQHLTHPTYRADIDGLRALAILSVLIYHAFPSALRGGFIGVDIFFVISGFLISGIIFDNLEHSKFSFREFYARRIRRLFPALVLILFACLAFGWFFLLPDESPQLGIHVAAGAGFISNFALWNEAGYFDPSASQKPLLHLWSLGIEEQFYVFWPLLLWLAYRRKNNFLAFTLAIAIASFIVNVSTAASSPVAAFYSPLSRFWELMVGGILAYLTLHKSQYFSKCSNLQSLTGLLLIAVALVALSDDSTFPGWWALLPTCGTFLILSAKPTAWLNRHVFSNRLLVWIGMISYPLYLWHWPLLFMNSIFSNPPSRSSRLIAVVLGFLLAASTYSFIEKPIRRARHIERAAIYLSVAVAICGFVGLASYLGGGFSFRLPRQFDEFTRSAPGDTVTDCILKDRYDFPAKCTEVSRRPAIFIWGDSHANSLYAGLKPLEDRGQISILQVTGTSCPPLLKFKSNGNNKCEEINNYALLSIRRTQPDIVVLHAIWESGGYDLSRLDFTVQQLKRTGVRRIVLLGPVPRWNGTLLRAIFRCWRPRSASEDFPRYSNCGLDGHVREVDTLLRQTAQRLDIKYISAYEALCNSTGCLTHVIDSGDQLVTYDYGHLSAGGSKYLVNTIEKDLFVQPVLGDAPR
jgi:peptidoglycan/LPS O-acetylase OafA/YrhL